MTPAAQRGHRSSLRRKVFLYAAGMLALLLACVWLALRQRHLGGAAAERGFALILALVAVYVICIAAVWLHVGRAIVRPLDSLADCASALAQGDLGRRVQVTSGDEIGRLQATFNAMAAQLQTQRDEWQRARDQAQAASISKSQFLANVSHDIRTPMNSIFVSLDMLLESPLSEDQQRYARLARAAAYRVLHLVSDVLDLSKIEAGRMELEIIDFDLHGLAAQTLALMNPRAAAKSLRLTLDVAAEVPRAVRGDAMRLGRVLGNLVDNGIKFTPRGEVRVALAATADAEAGMAQLRFTVRDSGIGLTAAAAQKVFEPFEQSDSAVARRYGGTGLGLAIAKQLVHMMGGTIGLESEPGNGSTFWFTVRVALSKHHDAAPAPAPAAAETPIPRGGRVLLVEDDEHNRELVRAMLSGMGLDVSVAHNGHEAVTSAAASRYDVILMDCHMPELDGFEATQHIRRTHDEGWRVPIVGLSANVMNGQPERCLAAGMDDFLAKPFTRIELQEVMRRWLIPD